MNWILAWRNLWRNWRRSIVMVASIAVGFMALGLFAGYTKSIYVGLGNVAVHGELTGHLMINKRGWLTQGRLEPARYMLTPDDLARAERIIRAELPQAYLVPRMGSFGLLSNGKSSTIFVGEGVDPDDLQVLQGPFNGGARPLPSGQGAVTILAEGLGQILNLKRGDYGTMLVSTLHGQVNAMDVDVHDTLNSGNVATNDKLLLLPLSGTRTLLDAPGMADRLTVLFTKELVQDNSPLQSSTRMQRIYVKENPGEAATAGMRDRLTAAFRANGLDLEVRTWQEVSAFYRQIKGIYDITYVLMLAVVLAVVILSVANSMSMAVIERTREIGTLRALGMTPAAVVKLFMKESAIMVVLGIGSGLALMLAARYGVNLADIRYVPPANTLAIPLHVGLDVLNTVLVAIFLCLLSSLATWLPALRAARQPIPNSLGHV